MTRVWHGAVAVVAAFALVVTVLMLALASAYVALTRGSGRRARSAS